LTSLFPVDLLCNAGSVNFFIFNKFDESDNFTWIDDFNTPAKILINSFKDISITKSGYPFNTPDDDGDPQQRWF